MLGPLSFLRISKCQNENKGWGCVISINELRDQQNKKKSYFFQLNNDGNFENIKKLKGPSILRNKTYIFQFSKKNGRKNL